MSLPDLRKKPSKTDIEFSSEQLKNFRYYEDVFPEELYSVIHDWYTGRPYFSFKTSGSTGAPKDLEVSRERILKSAKKTIDFLGLKPGLTGLLALKLDYIAGFMMLIRTLESGMDLHYFQPVSDPFEKLNPHRQYFAALVPLQVHALFEKKYDIRNFHSVIIGGAALNGDLKRKIAHLDYPVYETYGMTETVSHIALKRLNGADAHSYFRTLKNVEIDSDRRGCLKIRADVSENQWIQTNDVVQMISDQEFELLGRFDEVINSGGIKIHPLKLEDQLRELCGEILDKREFVIAKQMDSRLGEKAVLVIEGARMTEGDLDSIRKSFENIDEYHRPKDILFLAKFERTNSGKIKRMFINQELA